MYYMWNGFLPSVLNFSCILVFLYLINRYLYAEVSNTILVVKSKNCEIQIWNENISKNSIMTDVY